MKNLERQLTLSQLKKGDQFFTRLDDIESGEEFS
jgi:hypothetical protein